MSRSSVAVASDAAAVRERTDGIRLVSYAGLLVAVIAIVARAIGLFDWSLWEDEEATIYYALHPSLPFPSFFPVFFWLLKAAFSLSGPSVQAARITSALVGLASLWITYACFKKRLGRPVVLLAVLLLSVNLGHVFWSQSVRYYTLALCFQVISLECFLAGFEDRRDYYLVLANVAFALALLTHFSAILLLPVFIAYLLLAPWLTPARGYGIRSHLWFALPMAAVLLVFGARIHASQGMMGGWVLPSARDPLHVLTTMVAYFGVPLLVVGTLAGLRSRATTPVRLLLMCVAFVTVAELVTIATLNLINVTWYYGLVALVGFALLAADWIVELYERNRRAVAVAIVVSSVAYSVVWLALYFTVAAGDRPRWKEASDYVARASTNSSVRTAQVFATAPNVVAYYLGSPDGGRDGDLVVHHPGTSPDAVQHGAEEWYLMPAFEITPAYAQYFRARCRFETEFRANTGPRDRSVKVYHCGTESRTQ